MNPLDRLDAIVETLRVFGDEENAAWLGRAVQQHLRDAVPLDVSLGLKGDSTCRSARFKRLRRDLGRHLRIALRHCDGNQARLAAAISAYDYRRSRIRSLQAESELRQAIAAAFDTGLTVPQTGQGIGRILRNEPE